MKLNKNLLQITATAVITSLFFIIPMVAYEVSPFSSPIPPSQRISWIQATAMHDDYMGFRPLRVRIPEVGTNAEKKDLKGFIFKASDLQEILTANKSGQVPDEVYFQFGQEGRFGDDHFFGLLHDSGNIRMIAVGLRNKTLLNTNSSNGAEISVFDKADPCPPMCPN